MPSENIILTEKDRLILESYRNMLSGLADYMGEGYEIVLHSLESMTHSVIAISNGHHTGRKAGSPITDLALNMLTQITRGESRGYISYYSKNKNGEPLKACTIAIYGENQRIIGLLCINFYLDTPFSKIVDSFSNHQNAAPTYLTETFVDNVDDLVERVIEQIRQEVEQDKHILPSLKNKEIVLRCHAQGIFQIKSAIIIVAKKLDISKNTVYLHLRNVMR